MNKCKCEFCQEVDATPTTCKETPEKRFSSIKEGDEIVFLKQDEHDKTKWNFGYAKVVMVENLEGHSKSVCKTQNVSMVFADSPSYPFHVWLTPENILRNYDDEKRNFPLLSGGSK